MNPISRLINYIERVSHEKRDYKQLQVKVNALPKEYSYTYHKLEHYMWAHAGGDGMDILAIMRDVYDLFESGATQGKSVLDITGDDVAAFADDLLANAKTWTTNQHDALNKDIHRMIKKEEA
jgi:DNA-binding ferritin-like protein (Dps family)